ncbi:MAG: hypothetical protein AAF849_17825 [Bacteroidota bacterium]
MKFVSEQIIDEVVSQSEQGKAEQIAILGEEQPFLLAYLVSEQFELLTPDEQTYFIYLAWILHQSIAKTRLEAKLVEEEDIGLAEESNWAKIEAGHKKDFRKMLNPFFEETPQEDLLAFIEDSLVDEEEDFITTAGRELMFVGLKTVVDVLIV